MTNKEAMQRLFAILHDDRFSWTQESVDAFYVALEKLKNSTEELKKSNDCISRQDAIDAIQKYKVEHGYAYFDCASEIENDTKNLPSVQPEPEWGLPVSADRPLADVEIIPRLRQIQAGIPGGDYAIDRAIEIIEAVCRMEDDGK